MCVAWCGGTKHQRYALLFLLWKDETSMRVNGTGSLEMFGLDRSVVCAPGAMAGPCLHLLMQCDSTGNQEDACDLGKLWYLMQDQDPNNGGRCRQ